MSAHERRTLDAREMGATSGGSSSGNGHHGPLEEAAGGGGSSRRTHPGVRHRAKRSSRLSRHAVQLLANSARRLRQQVSEGLKGMGKDLEGTDDSGILEAIEDVEHLIEKHLRRLDNGH